MYCGGTAYFGEGNEHEANWCFAYDYYGFDEKWTDGGNMLEVRLNARVVQQGENQFWVTGAKFNFSFKQLTWLDFQ